MKIEVSENGELILREVFNGIGMITDDGEMLGVAMRGTGFEIDYMGTKMRMTQGQIEVLDDGDWTNVSSPEKMPDVFYGMRETIIRLDLSKVKELFDKTPKVPARWGKIESIPPEVLEELLLQMDSYLRTRKKSYKDITLVLNNWYTRRVKRAEQTGKSVPKTDELW